MKRIPWAPAGDRTARSWADPRPEQASFEDLLAVADLGSGPPLYADPRQTAREQAALGADVQLDGKACGYFARLSLARCRELGLDQPVYVAELDLRKMQENSHLSREGRGTAPVHGSSVMRPWNCPFPRPMRTS